MSQKWFNNIDLQQNELQNGVIQNLPSDPSSGKSGQIYYNTTQKKYRYYNGTAWVNITADAVQINAGNGLTSSGTNPLTISLGTPSTSGSGSNTYGSNGTTAESHTHQIKLPDASATAKGVVQLATQADVNTGTNTATVITPATLGKGKANGVASLDNNGKIITSQLPDYLLGQVMYGGNASAISTTGTTVSPSDSLKAKKGITAASISIVNSATSTTANTYGWQDLEGVYFICQANGTFANIDFETGDWIISTGSAWEKIDNTDSIVDYSQKSVQTFTGDGSKTIFDFTHSFGSDVVVQVYLTGQTVGSDTVDELIMVDTHTLDNKVKLVFATAPTASQTFKVVIIG